MATRRSRSRISWLHTAATVVSLSLSIAALTILLSLTRRFLELTDLLSPRPLAGIMIEDEQRRVLRAPPPSLVSELQTGLQCCDPVEGYAVGKAVLRGSSGARLVRQARVGRRLLELKKLTLRAGRSFDGLLPAELENSAIVSFELARSDYEGTESALGKTVTIDGTPLAIVGVLPAGRADFLHPGEPVEVVRPLDLSTQKSVMVLARLREGVTLSQAQAELRAFALTSLAAALPGTLSHWALVPASDLVESRARRLLGLALSAGLLLLLVAAVNVGHFIAVRTTRERPEVAIRFALGSDYLRFLSWTAKRAAALCLVAGGCAATLSVTAVNVVTSAPPTDVGFLAATRLDSLSLLFGAFGGFLLVSALSFVPLRFRTASEHARDLRADRRFGAPSRFGRRFGHLHIAALVASAVVFGVAAHLVSMALLKAAKLDPGFVADGLHVIDLRIPLWKYGEQPSRAELLDRLRQRLSALPGASSVVFASQPPLEAGLFIGKVALQSGATDVEPMQVVGLTSVGPGYFAALRQRVLAGREFSEQDVRLGAGMVVISEGVARLSGVAPEEAIGRFMSFDAEQREVIGVVANTSSPGMVQELSGLQVYWPLNRFRDSITVLLRSSEKLGATAASVAQALDPDLIVQASSMRELFAQASATTRFLATLFAASAGLAVALAMLGIYGGLSSFASQHRPQIAVRMALGAPRERISRWLLGLGLAPVAAGLVLGTLLSYPFCRLLEEQLFGMAPDSFQARLAAVFVVTATAVLAILPVAWRTSRLDPNEALRQA